MEHCVSRLPRKEKLPPGMRRNAAENETWSSRSDRVIAEAVYNPSSSASLLGVAAMRLMSHSIAELEGIC